MIPKKTYTLNLTNPLYDVLCKLVYTFGINHIINYNYDDTFYHALKTNNIKFQNLYDGKQGKLYHSSIYYIHGYMPMLGGVKTKTILAEQDYQRQELQIDSWANNVQINMCCSSSILFIGLSLIDSNIRRIFNICKSSSQNFHYAFLPISGDNPTDCMIDSLQDADLYRLGIKVIRYPVTKGIYDSHENLVTCIKFLLT